jgi:hypothetical protein
VRLKITSPQDLWCGIFFILLGALAIYLARDYQMGSATAMGPGYFPTWLGGIAVVFGIVIAANGFKARRAEPGADAVAEEPQPWGFRPWIVLPLALCAYAFMMDREVGFVPSLFVLVLGCAFAHKDIHWGETLVLAVCVTAGAVAIFSYGIELPYRLFWWSE